MPGAPEGPASKLQNSKRKRSSPKKAAAKKLARIDGSMTQSHSTSSAPGQHPPKQSKGKKSRDSPDSGIDRIQELLSAIGGGPSSSSLDAFPFSMGFPSMSNNINKLVNGISSSNPKVVSQSLEDMCELMMMSGDDIVFRLPVVKLLSALIRTLSTHVSTGAGDVPMQRMLLSARILGVLLDCAPMARQIVASSTDNIKALIDHIRSIELIELSDQCLVVLSRFSKEFPDEVLRADTLGAVLMNMEFFAIATQHTCLRIVEDLLSIESVDDETFSYFVEPAIPRLSELISHPDSSMGARISSCWRLAVEKWSRLDNNNSETDFVSSVLAYMVSSKSANEKLIHGLGLISNRSGALAKTVGESEEFLDLCVGWLSTGEHTARAVVLLLCSMLPSLVRAESPAVIAVDSARAEALGASAVARIGARFNEPVMKSVSRFAQLAPFAVQLILVQLMLGVAVDESVLNHILPILSDILAEYHACEDLTRLNGPLVMAAVRTVREIGTLYDHLRSSLVKYGILESVSKMACPAGRALRRRKSPPLVSPASGSVWGPLIRKEATSCAEAIPSTVAETPLALQFETLRFFEFRTLLEYLETSELTGHEFDKSGLVRKLLEFFYHVDTPEIVEVCKRNPKGFASLCALAAGRLERDGTALTSKVNLPDSSIDAKFVQCLSRPLRLSLVGPDGADLFVMTEALTVVRSMHDFLLSRSRDDSYGFDETGYSEEYPSDEFDSYGLPSDIELESPPESDIVPLSMNPVEPSKLAAMRDVRLIYKGRELDPESTFFETIATSHFAPKKNGKKTPLVEYDVEVGHPLVLVAPAASTPGVTPRTSIDEGEDNVASNDPLGSIFAASAHKFQYELVERESSSSAESPPLPSPAQYLEEASGVLAAIKAVRESQSLPDSFKLMAYLSAVMAEPKLPECPKLSACVTAYYTSSLTLSMGIFPDWIELVLKACPQVLSLAARKNVLLRQAGGPHRAIVARIEDKGAVPIMRQKIKIQRNRMIECALGVMNLYGTRAAGNKSGVSALPVIEIEFEGEEGTGSGPTNEFYASVVEIIKRDPLMFTLCADGSLYPRPAYIPDKKLAEFSRRDTHCATVGTGNRRSVQGLSSDESIRILDQWRLLGIIVGRCLVDSRLIDLDMHAHFWALVKQVLCERSPVLVDTSVMAQVDPAILSSIRAMEAISENELGDLGLDASHLPGRLEIKLKGLSGPLTSDLLPEFKEQIVRTCMYEGIKAQLQVFCDGLAEVVPVHVLEPFHPSEISSIIGGSGAGKPEFWTVEALSSVMHAAHGYTTQSEQFKNFIEILSELNPDERVSFVRFATGARSLPSNGFAGLTPPFTVVLAINEGSADNYLPSVMTCANFVKLPKYSSKEVMRTRILKAMNEGQGSFLLS